MHYLRTLADSKAIIEVAEKGKRAVVIGASFIGLEVAASLRQREVDVTVVAPESLPLERIVGAELATMVKALHDSHGVKFRLGTTAASIAQGHVTLKDGSSLQADFVVVGIGVRPDVSLARDAGLTVDNGVVVSAMLESSMPNVYAAGDIAAWPIRALAAYGSSTGLSPNYRARLQLATCWAPTNSLRSRRSSGAVISMSQLTTWADRFPRTRARWTASLQSTTAPSDMFQRTEC